MRTRDRPSAPRDEVTPRVLREEVLVVLSLTFLASAVSSIISLTEAPIEGVKVFSVPQVGFVRQLAGFVFGLAPVWLVAYLVRRGGDGVETIGLSADRPADDLLRGAVLFVVVAVAGIGVYLGAVALGVNRFVIPAPPPGHWWTWPVLFMNAIEAGLTEEIIVAAYLISRLRQVGLTSGAAVGASGLLRGAYHLYQGWGGFAGNLALGVLFGAIFARTRRTWPLVVAHVLLDVGAGAAYLLFRDRLPGFA